MATTTMAVADVVNFMVSEKKVGGIILQSIGDLMKMWLWCFVFRERYLVRNAVFDFIEHRITFPHCGIGTADEKSVPL